jgi:WD40 repeat protein
VTVVRKRSRQMSAIRRVPSFLVFPIFLFSVSERSEKAKRQRVISVRRHLLTLGAVILLGGLCGWPQPPPPSVLCVAWSPDGKRLATGSSEGAVKVWDANSGKELLSLNGRGSILSIAWSPDGTRLATASFDNTAKVWDAEAGKELLTLDFGLGGPVWSVAWSPDGKQLATGTGNSAAKVWDSKTRKELVTLSAHGVHSVAWSQDGRRLATGSEDYTAKVWDAKTGTELLGLRGRTGQVSSVAWGLDGTRLATGSGDGTAKLWNAATGKELMTLRGFNAGVWSVAWSPDGKRLAVGSDTAQVRDVESGKELLTLRAHRGNVFSVTWSPDGKRLATGGECNTTKVWDAGTGKELLTLEALRATFYGCGEEVFIRGGPRVRLGIEISLPDRAVFYIPVVGDGEMLGIVPLPKGRFAGVRITPRMRADSVQIEVSALTTAKKKWAEATCDEVRSWNSEDAGSYSGKENESPLLSGLGRLSLPILKVKVVRAPGPPPGGFHHPYVNSLAFCGCNYPKTRSITDPDGSSASGVAGIMSYPGAGKCVEVSGCGQCCRIALP